MATKLRDLLHEDPQDLWHMYFPGRTQQEVSMEWKVFGDVFIPELIGEINTYLDSLPVPSMNAPTHTRLFPKHFHLHIVDQIDLHLPHWSLVQRAVISEVIIRTVYDEAAKMWRDIVRIKNNITAEEAEQLAQNLKLN